MLLFTLHSNKYYWIPGLILSSGKPVLSNSPSISGNLKVEYTKTAKNSKKVIKKRDRMPQDLSWQRESSETFDFIHKTIIRMTHTRGLRHLKKKENQCLEISRKITLISDSNFQTINSSLS